MDQIDEGEPPEAASPYDGPALLHVGYMKTATTWLQKQVFNRPEFAATSRRAGRTGRPLPARPPKDRANVRRGGAALIVARTLNAVVTRSPLTPRRSLAERAAKRLLRVVDRAAPAALDRRIVEGWSARIAARYAGSFAESNRRLEALTGLDLRPYGYQ
ncbi:hypothetical protein P2H44_11725 [Albimonas sp. CAU 1670]|uniref:hypothetical protein n=1 Tax=Albimonas sp. CAU 1670 TaxID=3032599 RepID=UPI0023D9D68A|nr:hypothetical protein [Albimonas sp. CAU 1670]MDF2233221.1 hypothetical protein [Albimonas sp. CAU 1670]